MLDLGGIAKGLDARSPGRKLRETALLAFGQASARSKPAGWDGWGILLGDASGGFAGTAQLDTVRLVSGSLGQYAGSRGVATAT
jgi:hypothetical protein